jgi:hypothetical protein
VTDAMEPLGQDVEQEAPDELVGSERHHAIPRLGLHQCLSEKIDQGEPAHRQQVPFSGLVQAHTRGERGAFAPVAMESTGETDSLAEGTGFELSVPLLQKALLGAANRDVGTISGTT